MFNLIFIIMKTIFLKKRMTAASVVLMAISGAFLTTSMQSTSKVAHRDGYINSLTGICDIKVNCSDVPDAVCQANGQQAYGENCTEVLFQPL
jgi:hypothetical protein